MTEFLLLSSLVGTTIGVGIAFYFIIRRENRRRDQRDLFETYKWGAGNPDFLEEMREQCRAAMKIMADTKHP